MNELKIISKDILMAQADDRIRKGISPRNEDMCNIVSPILNGQSGRISDKALFESVTRAKMNGRDSIRVSADTIKKYGSAFDVPRFCKATGTEMTVRDMIGKGVFMASNSLIPDWQSLWDALRIDISVRKTALDTIRQNFYNIVNMPNSDKVFRPTEFYPYGVVFEENNGEGQSVVQGETLAGAYEDVEQFIYAAGFTWTLLAELFDKSLDPQRISDAVMLGYHAKQDDLSMSAILDYTYAGVQQTAASTVGTQRQELLYNTLADGLEELSQRNDPITERKISATEIIVLCSPLVGRHIRQVINGFNTSAVGGQDVPKNLPALNDISKIVEYDDEVINLRAKTITYTGAPDTKCYLVKKNRYMNVGIKRNLQLEVDQKPDVTTLARERRSWYFVEGQQTTGIASFIQEVTLPTW